MGQGNAPHFVYILPMMCSSYPLCFGLFLLHLALWVVVPDIYTPSLIQTLNIFQQICSFDLILMSEKPDKNNPIWVGNNFMNATLVVVVSNCFLFLVNFVMYPKPQSSSLCMLGRRFITQICL
jgi:hypothetical protein